MTTATTTKKTVSKTAAPKKAAVAKAAPTKPVSPKQAAALASLKARAAQSQPVPAAAAVPVAPLAPVMSTRKAEADRQRKAVEAYEEARDFAAANELRIKHIRPFIELEDESILESNNGGMTVVYRASQSGLFVDLAVGVCSPKDKFNRKLGLTTAVNHFKAGARIVLPVHGVTVDEAIERLFRDYFEVAYVDPVSGKIRPTF